jgi:hypothetical protein
MGHSVHLQFAPSWSTLGESYFVLGSWNLLWYGVLAAIALAGRALVAAPLAPLTLVCAAGAIVLFSFFAFPAIATGLGDRITLDRVTLQFAPGRGALWRARVRSVCAAMDWRRVRSG